MLKRMRYLSIFLNFIVDVALLYYPLASDMPSSGVTEEGPGVAQSRPGWSS